MGWTAQSKKRPAFHPETEFFPQNSVSSRNRRSLPHRHNDLRASVGNNDRCSLHMTANQRLTIMLIPIITVQTTLTAATRHPHLSHTYWWRQVVIGRSLLPERVLEWTFHQIGARCPSHGGRGSALQNSRRAVVIGRSLLPMEKFRFTIRAKCVKLNHWEDYDYG